MGIQAAAAAAATVYIHLQQFTDLYLRLKSIIINL